MSLTDVQAAAAQLEHASSLADVQQIVRHAARIAVLADGATFVLRDGESCFYADEDAISPLWKGQRFPLADCISGWAMLNDEVAIIPDIRDDERIPLAAYRPTFVRSLIMVPFGIEQPIGAIGGYWARLHTAGPDEVALLQQLGRETATAIARVGLDEAPFIPTTLASDRAERPWNVVTRALGRLDVGPRS